MTERVLARVKAQLEQQPASSPLDTATPDASSSASRVSAKSPSVTPPSSPGASERRRAVASSSAPPKTTSNDVDMHSSDGENADADMIDSDDDEVEHELPIYLSQALAPDLHLLQFPVTSQIEVPESARAKGGKIRARYKPKAKRLEMEIPLDVRPEYYDTEKGHEYHEGARLINEREQPSPAGSTAAIRRKEEAKREKEKLARRLAGEEEEAPQGILESIKLRSEVVPDMTTYMAGSIRDGALYLHPVNMQLQLRPSLDYLDALDEKAKEQKRRDRADDSDDEDDAGAGGTAGGAAAPKPEEKGKTISVALKKIDDGGKYGALGQSSSNTRQMFVAQMQAEAAEDWRTLEWETAETNDHAADVLERIFNVPTDELECVTKPLDMFDDSIL